MTDSGGWGIFTRTPTISRDLFATCLRRLDDLTAAGVETR